MRSHLGGDVGARYESNCNDKLPTGWWLMQEEGAKPRLQEALQLALVPGHKVDLLGQGCSLPYDSVAGLPGQARLQTGLRLQQHWRDRGFNLYEL